MKALMCHTLDGYTSLTLQQDVARPKPQADEVLIEMAAAAFNFADSLIVKGQYQTKPPLPFSPGLEGAGTIAAIGEAVTGFTIGQRVMAIFDWGGFADYAVAKATDVFAIPDTLDFATAASLPITYGTSHHGLCVKAGLKAGETVVIHGAAGGVGLTALQIAKQSGARVIATARGADKLAFCTAQGADHVLDYTDTSTPLRDRIKSLTDGLGAHVTYDPVGGDLFEESFRSTRPNGRILVVGFASGTIPQIPANIMMVKNITCIGYHWGAYRTLDPTGLRHSLETVLQGVQDQTLRPQISHAFAFEDFTQGYETLLARKAKGKIILRLEAEDCDRHQNINDNSSGASQLN